MNKFFSSNTMPLYYAFTSPKTAVTVAKEYKSIVEAVAKKCNWQIKDISLTENNIKFNIPTNKKAVAVGFSGGLDSVYLVHKLIDEGMEPVLFHVVGLNRQSPQEQKVAERISKLVDCKLVKIKFSAPKQHFPDNPFKNQLILSFMLDWGVAHGVTNYAIGSDWTTPLAEGVVGKTITDTIEVNEEYWKGVREHFLNAELIFIDGSMKKYERIQYLWREHRESFMALSSCISPYRFRDSLHAKNVKRYGIDLPVTRCGSCYKCAMEYILMVEAKLVEPNGAYLDHCWDVLATSTLSHRADLFSKKLPLAKRLENIKNYGS